MSEVDGSGFFVTELSATVTVPDVGAAAALLAGALEAATEAGLAEVLAGAEAPACAALLAGAALDAGAELAGAELLAGLALLAGGELSRAGGTPKAAAGRAARPRKPHMRSWRPWD